MSDFKDFNQLLVCLYFLLFVGFAGDISLLFSNDNADVESVREGHRIEIVKLIFSLYVYNQFNNFRMMV